MVGARVTIPASAQPILMNCTFWPRPAYSRPWVSRTRKALVHFSQSPNNAPALLACKCLNYKKMTSSRKTDMDSGLTSEAASTIKTGTRQFSTTQLNCRGFLNKIDYIHHLILTEWRSDIECLNETWLQPDSTTESHLSLENFSSFRRDRPHGSHGGLFVYVNVRVRCRRRLDLEHINIECITLEFYLNNTKHLLFFCYRPPNYSPSVFFNIFSTLLSTAEQENFVLALLGDFNSKHPSWDSSAKPNIAGTKLAGLLLDFGLS